MNPFRDTMPMTPAKKRGPVEITPEQADAAIRASWPQRTGSGLRLVQPMAAEAATDLCPDDDNGLPGVPVALAILAGLVILGAGALHVLFAYVLPWLGRVLS